METTQTSQSLYQALWNSADVLRSKMDANDYKSYLLGMIFYKYLSDKLLFFVAETMEEETESLDEALALYRSYYEDPDSQEDLISVIKDELNYVIKPDLTFTALVDRVNEGTFQLEDLAQGFRDIEQSDDLYENLFEDIDLYSKKLGATPQKQNQLVAAVMKELAVLDVAGHAGDMLGDAYEYLIGQFATDSGKKAGEFYTPQPVAKLMTQIAFLGREDEQGFTIYDATMGSGSLLLNAKKYSHQPQTVQYFGQELNTSTYNLARMNMILVSLLLGNSRLSPRLTLPFSCMVTTTSSRIMGLWLSSFPTVFFSVAMLREPFVKPCWKKGLLIPLSVYLLIFSLIPAFRPRSSFSKRIAPIGTFTLSMLLRNLIRVKTRIS